MNICKIKELGKFELLEQLKDIFICFDFLYFSFIFYHNYLGPVVYVKSWDNKQVNNTKFGKKQYKQ